MKNKEQWENFGREIYDIYNRLLRAEAEHQKLLPKAKRGKLIKAIELLRDFRSIAEDEMFKRGGPQDTKIWYPGGPKNK